MISEIMPFNFEGQDIRTVMIGGEPHFVGKDVAERLGYSDPTTAIRSHCRGVQILHPIPDALGRSQDMRVLTEPDLLRLIVGSNLPSAVRFQRWVFEDVLPSIRKTGRYAAAALVPRSFAEALRLAADLEEGKVKAEQERDHAIATKSQIGSRREATAMAAASAAVRESAKLRIQLGFNTQHATIVAVENSINRKFAWRPLKAWCKAHGTSSRDVLDRRYGTVKAWPAAAWQEVYGVDLKEVFGTIGEAA